MTVSIILATYNREQLTGKCLESLIRQTITNFEIIVVDDGSTDGTTNLLAPYSKNPRITVLRNDRNLGASAARNRGIAESRGEIVALIDSDCVAQPQWIEELIAPLCADPKITITTGNVDDPEPNNYWELVNKGENHINSKDGTVRFAISCNMAIRRNLLIERPFDASLRGSEDLDLSLALLKKGARIHYTHDAKVVHYRRSSLSKLLHQQFNWGYFNALVRIKHRQPPYISYGAWILSLFLILAPFSLILDYPPLRLLSCAILTSYLMLPFYTGLYKMKKTIPKTLICLPGLLLKCLADSFGNICYLWTAIIKKLLTTSAHATV